MESGQVYPCDFSFDDYLFLGEIGLGGQLKYFRGALPMIIAAKEMGYRKIVLPEACLEEASLVGGVDLFGFRDLGHVVAFLESEAKRIPVSFARAPKKPSSKLLDFAEVHGHRDVLNYVIAAVAGNHNLLMIGPPGCGKSMIAKRIPGIVPPMNENEVLEVTSIYSICGLLKSGFLMDERPFRAPHYNASPNALIGGGTHASPGEISLAHKGVLFLDELPEFNRRTLEHLRQPLEDRCVTISRVRQTNTYPADFQLVAAMNPCACGYYGTDRCTCSPYEIKRYKSRISGPIMDRIDIQKYMGKVNPLDLGTYSQNPSSEELRAQIVAARNIQAKRFKNTGGVTCNAQMESAHIREFCPLDGASKELLQLAFDRYQFSARAYNKIIKVARTFADLTGEPDIQKAHIVSALMARDLDKDQEESSL